MYGSSTEQLAKRYRHLFVLPSLKTSFLLLVVSTVLLVGLEVSLKQISLAFIWLPPLVAIASAFLVTRLVQALSGRKSIASTRRVLNLFFISTAIWLIPSTIGGVASLANHAQAGADEFVLGALFAWAFELLVINGAFLSSTLKSLVLAAVHPLLVMFSVTGYANPHAYPIIFGALTLMSTVLFLFTLKRLKTRNGIASLRLLQAFMNTWVQHEPSELEAYFTTYAKTESIKTEVMVAGIGTRKLCLVVPGVHPGPFSPVGSYNLSELIFRALHSESTTPIVLHGTGGHERNTPTNELASKYAQRIEQFVDSLELAGISKLRGPLRSRIGITNITTFIIGKDAIAIISSAPFVSDDLDPSTITDATQAAAELGLELTIVDAHNSIGGESRNQEAPTKDDWARTLSSTLALPENELTLGFAHSTEIGFRHGLDISEGGIGVTLFSTNDSKSILVTADSNNAISGLRREIADALEKAGFGFMELCTSDTHAFAARNLTNRGYFALGEDTKSEDIISAIETLARKAESGAAPCSVRLAGFVTETPLIGRESLDDFAGLTTSAISLAKRYAVIVAPIALLFILITLFY